MSDGDVSATMCQPIVMMFALPFHAELTSTMGPGSRKRRMLSTGEIPRGVALHRGLGFERGRRQSRRRPPASARIANAVLAQVRVPRVLLDIAVSLSHPNLIL